MYSHTLTDRYIDSERNSNKENICILCGIICKTFSMPFFRQFSIVVAYKEGLLLTCYATIDSDRKFCDDYYDCACSTNVPCMTPNDSQKPVHSWVADESYDKAEKYRSIDMYKLSK